MASTIGIKVANGDFFSIIEENASATKRLILTTVHDSQKSTQIDLYRSQIHAMADAQYIGSIVVENIKPKSRGEPSIELIISSNEQGEITADAVDLDSPVKGEHLHLAVSLKSLDIDDSEYNIPDFELEQPEPPPQGLYEKASRVRKQEEKKKIPWIIIIIIGVVIILAGLAIWFFLLRSGPTSAKPAPAPAAEQPAKPAAQPSPAVQSAPPEPRPAPPVQSAPPEPKPAPAVQSAPPEPKPAPEPGPVPVIEAGKTARSTPAQAVKRGERLPAPVSSYNVPAVIPRGGVAYKIRWGDTLWDISEAFYRNPWLYPRIARYNNIRNPDLIISGTTIRIPQKN